jgi:guanylate kinase
LAFEDRFDVTVVNDNLDEASNQAEKLVRQFISAEVALV